MIYQALRQLKSQSTAKVNTSRWFKTIHHSSFTIHLKYRESGILKCTWAWQWPSWFDLILVSIHDSLLNEGIHLIECLGGTKRKEGWDWCVFMVSLVDMTAQNSYSCLIAGLIVDVIAWMWHRDYILNAPRNDADRQLVQFVAEQAQLALESEDWVPIPSSTIEEKYPLSNTVTITNTNSTAANSTQPNSSQPSSTPTNNNDNNNNHHNHHIKPSLVHHYHCPSSIVHPSIRHPSMLHFSLGSP